MDKYMETDETKWFIKNEPDNMVWATQEEREKEAEKIMIKAFKFSGTTIWVSMGMMRWPLPSKQLAIELITKVINVIYDDYGELLKKPILETIGHKRKWYFSKGAPICMADYCLAAKKKATLDSLCDLETERKRVEGLA
ncbi:hypothetical protein LCGC14_0643070 [marine sediment metagenome]|uniref:Uncharacterized protein n=1 Tax=marine sediment metagenome TaxID=412755 RepID=A0A0F9RI51_9ZZZZ